MSDAKKFVAVCPEGCTAPGNHFHQDDWNGYWNSLTEAQRQSLRDKAAWEHMTVSRVASIWGATNDGR